MLRTICIAFLLVSINAYGQNKIDINAEFNVEDRNISIKQSIEYFNRTADTLTTIYLNDWSNSYSIKTTPLAKRFAEEFSAKFHFAKSEDRGFTVITTLSDESSAELEYERLKTQQDVIKVKLKQPFLPGESYKLNLQYIVNLPDSRFTGYGINGLKEISLSDWYISPAVYDGDWHYYSNKNLDDFYAPVADLVLQASFPNNYNLISELDQVTITQFDGRKIMVLAGKDRVDSKLFLKKYPSFKSVQTDDFTIISDISEKGLTSERKAIITDKITRFITKTLGEYPHEKLLVTELDASKNPIYGLNQLPDFIRPFPPNFQFEMTLLKNTIGNFLDNVLLINPRKDNWLRDGIQIYLMIKYMEENYPEMKLIGSLAKIWGIRSFHVADVDFNEQYRLIYLHMARTNRDQPLSMPKDSLTKFNSSLANPYKAGVGLRYLDDYLESEIIYNGIKDFLNAYRLKPIKVDEFKSFFSSRTVKDIDWFFDDYVNTNKKIDYRIKNLKHTDDSISFTVKNKRDSNMPVSLYSIANDSVIGKRWIRPGLNGRQFTIPRYGADQISLNYEDRVPEFNMRDNYKSLKGFFFNRKPLQLRLFKDLEDPRYNQVYLMPLVEFDNIYDGLTLGPKIYNKSVIRRRFNYKISPVYAFNSRSVTGSASVLYYNYRENKDLFRITYTVGGRYQSYADGLFFRSITPAISFAFRDKDDLRSNEFQFLNFRYLDIRRDRDPNNPDTTDEPNYGVFNARYVYSDDNLINFKRWFADLQFAKTFGKIALNYEYRRLFVSNRQFNLRFYAGAFIYNNNPEGFNYFSFALDRPTDYLFDYDYLGRSEDTGIYSQQLIIAEGGFKSQLEPAFANQWITTANFSTNIWRYIEVYGDIGLVKNREVKPKFVYDSGIRLNLVADYFEVYFPVYSSLGWEIGQSSYDQKIRFVFTVDPEVLLGLFRRRWY